MADWTDNPKLKLMAEGVNRDRGYDPYSSESFNSGMDAALRDNGDNDVRSPTKSALDKAAKLGAGSGYSRGGAVSGCSGHITLAQLRKRHGGSV